MDNSHNEVRGGRVERDAGRDEKQLIKFAWPNIQVFIVKVFLHYKSRIKNCLILLIMYTSISRIVFNSLY